MEKRKDTDLIVLHCSDTPNNLHYTSKQIKEYHVKYNGWSDIGYHYVILTDGTIEKGRSEELIGAHASNCNLKSIGICLIGGRDSFAKVNEDNFTSNQFKSLEQLLNTLLNKYKNIKYIAGHNKLTGVNKLRLCPIFNVNNKLTEFKLDNYILKGEYNVK